MTDPKQPGLPEAIATAVVPAKLAAKLDASDHWSNNWRSALRLFSNWFNAANLAIAITSAVTAYAITAPMVAKLPLWLASLFTGFASIGAMVSTIIKQSLPEPPPQAQDDSDNAGA